MLVLTRKLQEKIHIGDNITLTIVKVKGNTVRVGIEAPREVRIVRGELPQEEEADSDKAKEEPTAAPQATTLPLNALIKALAGGASTSTEPAPARRQPKGSGPLSGRMRASSASAV